MPTWRCALLASPTRTILTFLSLSLHHHMSRFLRRRRHHRSRNLQPSSSPSSACCRPAWSLSWRPGRPRRRWARAAPRGSWSRPPSSWTPAPRWSRSSQRSPGRGCPAGRRIPGRKWYAMIQCSQVGRLGQIVRSIYFSIATLTVRNVVGCLLGRLGKRSL